MLLCAELRRYHGSPKPLPGAGDELECAVGIESLAEDCGSTRDHVDAMLDEIIEQDRRAARRMSAEEARRQGESRKETIRKVADAALEKFKEQERIRQEELAYRQYLARRRRLMAGGVAVAVLLLVVVLPWFSRLHVRSADRGRDTLDTVPPVVARIARSSHAQWLDPGLSTMPGTLLTASSICLTEGLAELAYEGGTTVLLQAPATVRLETDERLFLDAGTVSIRIGEDSAGFIVRTPT
ncbi:MAG: hypothetical protein IH616_19160, partial [Gemmatimonadales bacterium]|nr:hypothetical protein [Gemmatimonadales bacterium]